MSSGKSNDWTTLTIRRSVSERLDDFCDTYDITGKGEAIDTLLTLTNAAGLPLHSTDETEKTLELDVDSIADIQGFIVGGKRGQPEVVGVDAARATLISDVSEATASVQPMLRTKITNGTVICPACGEDLLSYELAESLPGIETGVFNGFSVACETCDSTRPQYTLFVSKPDVSPPAAAIKGAALSYMAYILIIEPQTTEMFEDRLEGCQQLAEDGGWEWLPDPSTWIGFEIEEAGIGPVTTEMYVDFFKGYLRVLTEALDDVHILDVTVSSPEETEEYFDSVWQVELETRGASPLSAVSTLEDMTSGWASVSVGVEEIDVDSFAEDTIVLSLHGLSSIEVSEESKSE